MYENPLQETECKSFVAAEQREEGSATVEGGEEGNNEGRMRKHYSAKQERRQYKVRYSVK